MARTAKRRPPIRLIIIAMLLIAMATPLVGLFFLRVIENQFVRRTEAELIGQTSTLAAIYAERVREIGVDPAWFGPKATGDFASERSEAFLPLTPDLDLAVDPILPPRPAPMAPLSPPNRLYYQVAEGLGDVVRETRRRTLAGILLLDPQGRILTGPDRGQTLAHVEEVAAAMKGEFESRLRTRLRERPPPFIYSFTKGASLRIFVAHPVVVRGRVAGVVYASRTPKHILQMAAEEQDKLIFAALAMACAVGLFALIASRAITRPIRALTELTRAVDAGDRSALRPLDTHGSAEMAELSDAFLRTARRLHDRSDDLAAFAAHVSHELKSPLTAIQGAAELIRDSEDVMSAEDRRAFLDNMIEDTTRMALLVRRLLELARADAKNDDGHAATSDVADEVAVRAPIPVEINDPLSLPLAISAEKLGIILANMADNAALHGASALSVSVKRIGDAAEIWISDNGEGVSPANRAKIFEPFFTTRRKEGGTGMGLPIIKALLEARGGAIALSPEGPGARFRLTLPLAA